MSADGGHDVIDRVARTQRDVGAVLVVAAVMIGKGERCPETLPGTVLSHRLGDHVEFGHEAECLGDPEIDERCQRGNDHRVQRWRSNRVEVFWFVRAK